MRSDGDGWAECERGHRHWGVFGAAGLLLTAPGDDAVVRVLLQHRAAYCHHGDTWGVPGGARGRFESAQEAALREAAEETGLHPGEVQVDDVVVDDHGGWAYATVLARAPRLLEVHAEDRESTAVEWVPLAQVEARVLHPGFAASWPRVLAEVLRLDEVERLGQPERLGQLERNSANSSPGP